MLNTSFQELPKDKWFCSENCNKIFEALQNMAYSGPDFIPAPVSAALFEKHSMIGLNGGSYNEIQWCVLTGKSRFRDHLMLLSQAAAIFRVSSYVFLIHVFHFLSCFAVEWLR